ncbi:MAG: amidohydrolase family protein [Treponema sp.]|jgi:N-acyl-D-amino-acid deacylase|nr:amidohydrolase family protein [Treponema sp.]
MALYDIVIAGARVIDPDTGTDEILNAGISGGSIAALSRNSLAGKQEIDGGGLVLAPGFIDLHTHEDTIEGGPGPLNKPLENRFFFPNVISACAMRTGNTFIMGGNCGYSNYPMGAYLEKLEALNLPINCMSLVGNVTLRQRLGLGDYDRASPMQIAKLKSMAAAALKEGAAGISFGLQYAPGTEFGELLALCSAAAEAGKFFAVHMRYDVPAIALEGVEEVIAAAKITGAGLQISHLASNVYGENTAGENNIKKAALLIDEARKGGADIYADVYPYNVWATSIQSAVFDQGVDEFNFEIEDLELISGEMAGQYCTPELFEKLRNAPEDTMVACHNAMPSEDIEDAYKLEYACVGSDALLTLSGDHIKGHPRSAGSPARFLKEFVREKKSFPLIEGLRKLTLNPAKRLGLEKKGRVQEGCDADLVLFDFDKIADRASYGIDVCALPSEGIRALIAGGRLVHSGAAREG